MNNTDAKQILIYGDSYTYGKIPGGQRYNRNTRYTGILQQLLGDSYNIIEEGLRGRTLYGENQFFPFRNGYEQFGPIFGSHLPIDLLIFFLGTNDCNSGSTFNAVELTEKFHNYLERIEWWSEHLGFTQPKIMIIAPPSIKENESYKAFKDIFLGSEVRISKLPGVYKAFAEMNQLEFIDSSKIIEVSDVDGIHLDTENNKKLAEALAKKIQSLKI